MAFKLNGTEPVPMPCAIEPEINDVHSSTSGRNAQGDALIDVINKKDKYSIEWNVLTFNEAHSILALMPESGFEMTYDDPDSGAERTARFYRGNRNLSILKFDSNGKPVYRNMKVSVIEI